MSARVLLVEDDPSLGQTLYERLEREQYLVVWAQTVAEAESHLACGHWDLAVLDVKLPDGSGFGLARFIQTLADIGCPIRKRLHCRIFQCRLIRPLAEAGNSIRIQTGIESVELSLVRSRS